MRRIAILLLLLPLNSGLPQEISPPTIQVISRLVVIDVLVRDKRTGARVDNLTADHFRVFDEGRRQVITQFGSTGHARPLALALVVEANAITRKTLPTLKSALLPAFGRLRPEDELMVLRMLPGTQIVQDLTADREAAAGAFEEVARRQQESMRKKGKDHEKFSFEENLSGALLLATRHIHERRPGSRPAIIVITADLNIVPTSVVNQTANELLSAGVSVHALIHLDIKLLAVFKTGIHVLFARPDIRLRSTDQTISYYSLRTGGEPLNVKNDDFGPAFEQVLGDLAASYSIGFVPDADRLNNKFHKLTVEVQAENAKDLTVHARRSYFVAREHTIAAESPSPESGQAAATVPGISPEPGVYYMAGGAFLRLAEAPVPQVKLAGKIKALLTQSILRTALIQIYPQAQATLRISDSQPVLFIRQRRPPSLARLVRLEQRKDERWMRVGLFLDQDRQAAVLVITRVGDDLFRVTPAAPLAPGEYLLSLDELAAPVYDFGIVSGSTPSMARR